MSARAVLSPSPHKALPLRRCFEDLASFRALMKGCCGAGLCFSPLITLSFFVLLKRCCTSGLLSSSCAALGELRASRAECFDSPFVKSGLTVLAF